MAFGQRGVTPAPAAGAGRSAGRPERARPSGPVVARRGGYWAGLGAAALGFLASGVLTTAYAFARSGSAEHTPGGVMMLILVKIALPAMVTYAISLGLVDLVLRAVRVGGRTAYALLCPIIPALLLIGPAWAARPVKATLYLVPLILPGAIIGGLVLGGFRRRASA